MGESLGNLDKGMGITQDGTQTIINMAIPYRCISSVPFMGVHHNQVYGMFTTVQKAYFNFGNATVSLLQALKAAMRITSLSTTKHRKHTQHHINGQDTGCRLWAAWVTISPAAAITRKAKPLMDCNNFPPEENPHRLRGA